MKYTRKEIDDLILNPHISNILTFENEYSKKRILEISLITFHQSGLPGSKYYHSNILTTLRQEWIKEIQNVCNPFVLYTLKERIMLFRKIIDKKMEKEQEGYILSSMNFKKCWNRNGNLIYL